MLYIISHYIYLKLYMFKKNILCVFFYIKKEIHKNYCKYIINFNFLLFAYISDLAFRICNYISIIIILQYIKLDLRTTFVFLLYKSRLKTFHITHFCYDFIIFIIYNVFMFFLATYNF